MFHKSIVTLLMLNFSICTCNSQCLVQQLPVQQNFDIDKYLSKWYEIRWRAPKDIPANLQFVDYENNLQKQKGNDNITVTLKYRVGSPNSPCQTATGTLFNDGPVPAKLKFVDPALDGGYIKKIYSDYWVIATDYTDFALVYSCGNILPDGTCHPDTVDAAIWRRKKAPMTKKEMSMAEMYLQAFCIEFNTTKATDHNHPCDSSTRVNAQIITIAFIVVLVRQILH